MHIKSTRRSTDNYTLFNATEGNTMTLIRNHVRAIDNSDDELLKVYLDAAIDYMENMSDRLLGVHDVEFLIDKDESKYLMSAPIDSVTSVGPLFYNAKDPDDESPHELKYTMITEDALDTGVEYTLGDDDDFGVGREYEVGTTTHSKSLNLVFNVSVIDTTIDGLNVDQVNFQVQKQASDGTWTASVLTVTGASMITIKAATANGDTSAFSLSSLPAGKYRIEAQAVNSPGQGETKLGDPEYDYFNITNGRDFKNLVDTNSYPIYIDIRKGLDVDEVEEDGTDFNKHFWKLHLTAGTALDTLPAQYKQAALLLIGHYYNMREAEVIGGISVEIKEGVRRLMASVRKY